MHTHTSNTIDDIKQKGQDKEFSENLLPGKSFQSSDFRPMFVKILYMWTIAPKSSVCLNVAQRQEINFGNMGK